MPPRLHSPRPELVGSVYSSHKLHGVDHGRISCPIPPQAVGLCARCRLLRGADKAVGGEAQGKARGQGPGRNRGRSLLQRCWMRVGVPVRGTQADKSAGLGWLIGRSGLDAAALAHGASDASSRTRASGSIRFRSPPSMDMIPDSRFHIPDSQNVNGSILRCLARRPGPLPRLPSSTALQLQAINPLVQRRRTHCHGRSILSCRHRRCRPASRPHALALALATSPRR
jgi:hypothetical protein